MIVQGDTEQHLQHLGNRLNEDLTKNCPVGSQLKVQRSRRHLSQPVCIHRQLTQAQPSCFQDPHQQEQSQAEDQAAPRIAEDLT